jgi:hypothetical protein
MGDSDTALFLLKRAATYYEQSDLVWRRSVAEAYLALLLARRGEHSAASKHLHNAEKCAALMKNPYESGVVWSVKALLRARMSEDATLAKAFCDTLGEPVSHYRLQAQNMLSVLPFCYEATHLQNIDVPATELIENTDM